MSGDGGGEKEGSPQCFLKSHWRSVIREYFSVEPGQPDVATCHGSIKQRTETPIGPFPTARLSLGQVKGRS